MTGGQMVGARANTVVLLVLSAVALMAVLTPVHGGGKFKPPPVKCKVSGSGQPEWPSLSPARLAAVQANSFADVVKDFLDQVVVSGKIAKTDALPHFILLHSTGRILLGRLQEIQGELRKIQGGVFEKVVIIEGTLDTNAFSRKLEAISRRNKSALFFSDDPNMIAVVVKKNLESIQASMYEGYNFGSPNIASGLRLFAAMGGRRTGDKTVLSHADGTLFPGGVDWYKAKTYLSVKGHANSNASKNMQVARQAVMTTSYMAMEDLLHGMDQTLQYMFNEMEKHNINDWILLYRDMEISSNCWIARWVNWLVQRAKSSKDHRKNWKTPKDFVPHTHLRKLYSKAEKAGTPYSSESLYVLVMDDNSCSGGQMSSFISHTLGPLLSSKRVPDLVRVSFAPIFSTRRAGNMVLRTAHATLGPSAKTATGANAAAEDVNGYQLKLDSVRRFKYSLNEKWVEIELIQYVQLLSIETKVFQATRIGLNEQAMFKWTYEASHLLMRQVASSPFLLMGKVTTVFDWKIVDKVSMPQELTEGRVLVFRGGIAPIWNFRFMQPSCPPYKVAELEQFRLIAHACGFKHLKVAQYSDLDLRYECDSLNENRFAVSFSFAGYSVASREETRCRNEKTTHVFWVPQYHKPHEQGSYTYDKVQAVQGVTAPELRSLCQRIKCERDNNAVSGPGEFFSVSGGKARGVVERGGSESGDGFNSESISTSINTSEASLRGMDT